MLSREKPAQGPLQALSLSGGAKVSCFYSTLRVLMPLPTLDLGLPRKLTWTDGEHDAQLRDPWCHSGLWGYGQFTFPVGARLAAEEDASSGAALEASLGMVVGGRAERGELHSWGGSGVSSRLG